MDAIREEHERLVELVDAYSEKVYASFSLFHPFHPFFSHLGT